MDSLKQVVIITPCYNENITIIKFLAELEETLSHLPYYFNVVVVDDCSNDNTVSLLKKFRFKSFRFNLTILMLKYNVGHQRAIYQGLLYSRDLDAEHFIVMDSDGEDDPTAIIDLIDLRNYEIVNVVRGRRQESFTFQFFYIVYKLIFRVITGKNMNFGNYCMISKNVLENSVMTSFLHFAAYLSKQKKTSAHVVYSRRKRLDGSSKMNLSSLVHHAFRSFIEYADEFLMVFLKLFMFIATVFFSLILYVVYVKIFTDKAILGWASTLSVGLFSLCLMCLGFFIMGILLLNILSRNNQLNQTIYSKFENKVLDQA